MSSVICKVQKDKGKFRGIHMSKHEVQGNAKEYLEIHGKLPYSLINLMFVNLNTL